MYNVEYIQNVCIPSNIFNNTFVCDFLHDLSQACVYMYIQKITYFIALCAERGETVRRVDLKTTYSSVGAV